MGNLTLILGGARSGKSTFAENLAAEMTADSAENSVLYVATAQAWDDEMRARIVKHQQERPSTWKTVEAPLGVADTISAAIGDENVILLDCMTVLTSNILLEFDDPFADEVEEAVNAEIDALLAFIDQTETQMIIVSNEVGMGLVPPYPLGRAYRDLLGKVNQRLAARAEVVKLLVAGIPMAVKG